MSDDFDREAERERLREKYERDKAKREASERMSELLLQGATMTNRHCPECHSPVFRHDGTEFCPTCEQVVADPDERAGDDEQVADDEQADDETTGDGAADEAEADVDGEAADAEEPTTGEDGSADETEVDATTNGEATDATAAEPRSAVDADADAAATPDRAGGADPAESTPAAASSEPPGGVDADRASRRQRSDTSAEHERQTGRERRPARGDLPARPAAPEPGEAGDLADAEAALRREIARLARRAEETRDVGRKRDLFAAIREAAEALAAVRRR